jgi:hypothetical protein
MAHHVTENLTDTVNLFHRPQQYHFHWQLKTVVSYVILTVESFGKCEPEPVSDFDRSGRTATLPVLDFFSNRGCDLCRMQPSINAEAPIKNVSIGNHSIVMSEFLTATLPGRKARAFCQICSSRGIFATLFQPKQKNSNLDFSRFVLYLRHSLHLL